MTFIAHSTAYISKGNLVEVYAHYAMLSWPFYPSTALGVDKSASKCIFKLVHVEENSMVPVINI